MRDPTGTSPQIFNNADSFAQAFDAAWRQHDLHNPDHGLDRDTKLARVLEQVADHPFRIASPELAEDVARFRLRLLGF
ncbi:hypothetical protein [Aphanothece microscopica]